MDSQSLNRAIRQSNRTFRELDESHRWPVNGRCNVTERAIRRLRDLRRQGLVIEDAPHYETLLEDLIAQIVNAPHCWDTADRIRWRDLA